MIFLFIILIILVFKGFILFEEETLIILASLVWVFAAGDLILQTIKAELEDKGDLIKDQYLFFLKLKRNTILSLLDMHKSRINLDEDYVAPLRNFFISNILNQYLNNYVRGLEINKNYYKKTAIAGQGQVVVNELLMTKLESILRLLKEDSSSK